MNNIHAIMQAMRQEEFQRSPQLSLGALLDRCQKAAAGKDEDCRVCFDFEYARPTAFHSWRGIYAELALGFEMGGEGPKVADFIKQIKEANGHTFCGYKGGDFCMTLDTPVWVANYGNAGNTAIVGVKDCGWQIVLETAYCET